MEKRDVDTPKIPKTGFKLLGYEGGRLPIFNVNGGGKNLEVADMCEIPRLQEVI